MIKLSCRVCGHDFFEGPLLRYANMPGYAQHLPDAGSLEREKGVDLEICQCSGCGLVQLGNDPVPYYREVIRAVAFSEDMKLFRLEQFKSFARKYSLQDKKVIEIGCGRGEYLLLMQQSGVDAYGLEYCGDAVKQGIDNGLKVSKGFIERGDAKLKDAPFDAFFILNFLEHLPDPNSTLQGISNNLTAGAVGLVEVPNFDMIARDQLFAEFTGDHLFYFTTETLTALLRRNGFEILECSQVWHDYIISAIVQKRQKLDLNSFYKTQARLKNEIETYIRRFKHKKVAVWGASHQAFALISLINLAGKIRYVVDSAPFKQGKYTPATHIPIVAPDALNEDPVDAVIVMAASYSEEVVKIIKQKFNKNMGIAVLRNCVLEIIR